MSKKFFSIGLTVLLGVSLFLTGCPTGGDEPSVAEQAASELAAALSGKATVSGTTVTLTGEVTIGASTPLTIPAGVTLVVPTGLKLKVDVSSTLNVAAGATLNVAGTYEITAGIATSTNNGTVTVKSGGEIKNGTGVNIGGSGTNVVEAGGTVYFNGDTTPFIGPPSNVNAKFQLGTGATFSYNNTDFVVTGPVTLAKAFELASQVLTVGADGTLTLNAVLTITNNDGTSNTGKVLGTATSSTITTTGSGGVTLTGTRAGFKNFYLSGNTTAETSVSNNKTYKWAADAGGGSNAGWKAQS